MRLGLAKNSVIENGNMFGEGPKVKAPPAYDAAREAAADRWPSEAIGALRPERGFRHVERPVRPVGRRGRGNVRRARSGARGGGRRAWSSFPASNRSVPRAPRRLASPAPASDEPPKASVRRWKLRGAVVRGDDPQAPSPRGLRSLSFADEEIQPRDPSRRGPTPRGATATIVPSLSDRGYSRDHRQERSRYAPNYLDPGTEGVPRMAASRRKRDGARFVERP